jgi:crotonobetainyl-CoA:carnitine CoA-transferase CaiB-like acyl-CoA transferase
MSYDRPYEGLRVLDVSQGFAGPYAAGLMSLYGASVTKVEPPGGDWIRGIGTAFDGQTALGAVANRGKRSIAIDLKTDGGRDLVHRMAKDADVFVESFRPGVAKRLGIAYDDIRALNPRILYLSVSGYGQDGPGAGRPATDMVIQANSGFMSVNKSMDGVPVKSGVLIADTATGIYAFQALAAALFAREREK